MSLCISLRSTNGYRSCCRFLVSFLADARGGAMRGCRHSGIRIIIPPLRLCQPTRITCKLVRLSKLAQPPPLMEGEALASRVLVMGPSGAKFMGYVVDQKIALFYYSNNFIKPSTVLVIFGIHVPQSVCYHGCILRYLQTRKLGTSLRFVLLVC